MDIVILNLDQIMRTIPVLAHHSPNIHHVNTQIEVPFDKMKTSQYRKANFEFNYSPFPDAHDTFRHLQRKRVEVHPQQPLLSVPIPHPEFCNWPITLTFKMVRDRDTGHSCQRKKILYPELASRLVNQKEACPRC
ncbi:hypothetical protein TNCV_3218921 [Trichonephila clavipes]|nr:hypothetical protein TNCV_3218921 [Trichonephila clavipes]